MIDIKRYRQLSKSAPTEGLATIPDWAIPALEEAYERYMAFSGVLASDDDREPQIREDRANFHYLYVPPSPDGKPSLDTQNEIQFMHLVSELPIQWCIAWSYADWVDTIASGVVHGDPEKLIRDAYQYARQATSEQDYEDWEDQSP
jgi:hypothetical protein